MAAFFHADRLRGNLLLDTLNDDEYRKLAASLRPVDTRRAEVIAPRGTLLTHVYFPRTGVFSVLASMSDGAAVEVGTVGREGFLGIEALAAGEQWTETTICQIEGQALRMPLADFSLAVGGDTPLRRIAQRYLLRYLSLVSQSVACNRLHTIEERFARWILMTHDRVDGNELKLTQEFLAYMLGVQRPSVSLVASTFQQAGLIRYHRGHMEILDRLGLEDASCECYAIVKEQFDQMLGSAAGDARHHG
jgi:CRP-like cAMP-binding protein